MRLPVVAFAALWVPALLLFGGGPASPEVPHAIPDKEVTRAKISGLIQQFQSTKSKATLGLLAECIDLSISYGAPAWNEKDHEECLNFYRKTVESLAEAFPDAATATPLAAAAIGDMKAALVRLKDSTDVEKNAWILRYAFDKTAVAVDVESSRAASLLALGSEYMERDDFDDAQNAFGAAVATLPEMHGRNPEHIPPIWRIAPIANANALFGQKKYHEAAAAIAQGLEGLPEWAQSKSDLRTVYGSPVIYDALMSDLKAQIRRTPDDAALQFLLGYECFYTGDKETARTLFEKTLKLDPKNSSVRLFLDPVPAPDGRPAEPLPDESPKAPPIRT